MHEFTRAFEQAEEELTESLEGFPGTFRIYAKDISPGFIRCYVEFLTNDSRAAKRFLEDHESRDCIVKAA